MDGTLRNCSEPVSKGDSTNNDADHLKLVINTCNDNVALHVVTSHNSDSIPHCHQDASLGFLIDKGCCVYWGSEAVLRMYVLYRRRSAPLKPLKVQDVGLVLALLNLLVMKPYRFLLVMNRLSIGMHVVDDSPPHPPLTMLFSLNDMN